MLKSGSLGLYGLLLTFETKILQLKSYLFWQQIFVSRHHTFNSTKNFLFPISFCLHQEWANFCRRAALTIQELAEGQRIANFINFRKPAKEKQRVQNLSLFVALNLNTRGLLFRYIAKILVSLG